MRETKSGSATYSKRPDATAIAARIAPKRVVIVDDSWAVRAWLRAVLEEDKRLMIVGEADSAEEARQVIKDTNPDVITLDIQMPGMDGLEFLSHVMRLRPLPVVMISNATRATADATVTALSLGAIDCIMKPSEPLTLLECRDITRRIYSAACSRVRSISQSTPNVPRVSGQNTTASKSLILIGASTGGVAALNVVLGDLDPSGPPVVVVQHMPGPFLVSFSQKLDRQLPQDVAIADPSEPLKAGQVRLAPSMGKHTEIIRRNRQWYCRFRENTEEAWFCPSVDVLFKSATPFAPSIMAIILTGLGRDGAEGMLLLHQAGARTLGQDEESSVVYGMPKAAWSFGAVQQQLPLTQLGAAAVSLCDELGSPMPRRAD